MGVNVAELGAALAANRRSGTVSRLPLNRIGSLAQAEAIQSEANFVLDDVPTGYVMAATTANTQRRLGCDEPIYGRAFPSTVLPSGSEVRMPEGALGAGCGWVFTLGLPYPPSGETISRESLEPFIIGCAVTIEILGRRVPGGVPLNGWTATADFALHVVSIVSPPQANWPSIDLGACEASLVVDGHVLAKAIGKELLGHPLNPVVWLAQALQARGKSLNAFDRVFVGSCTNLLQVLPAQHIRAEFGGFDAVDALLG